MVPKIEISSTLLNRLNNIKDEPIAYLYGLIYQGNLIILGLKLIQEESNNSIPFDFVTEIDFCGVVVFGNLDQSNTETLDLLKKVDITDNPILLNYSSDSIVTAFIHKHDRLEKTNIGIKTEEEIFSEFVHLRVVAEVELKCEWNLHAIINAFSNLHKKITSGQVAFHLSKSNIYLLSNNVEKCSGITENSVIYDACNQILENNSKNKKSKNKLDVLTVELFFKPTQEKNSTQDKTNGIYYAPVIKYKNNKHECLNICLKIDSLSMLYKQTKISRSYEILIESVCRNLRLNEQCLLMQLNKEENVSLPTTYHFLPKEIGHFITVVYPANMPDSALKNNREFLHEKFFLSTIRPVFKRQCSYNFEVNQFDKLLNPDENLPSPFKNCEVYKVDGKYTYYHYNQDDINDDGWGCAYRSLQTICSWLWLQGYTDKKPPTHLEIQKCLVKIGDKNPSFINSSQWIGSTEVSFYLDEMYGIQSRILNINSGDEIIALVPQLKQHFQMNGSPIMIGGGVLAHTILGVGIDSGETDDVQFLVLDPHYKGSDDLQIILNKGWCGWKNANFWKSNAFYNLCLPQIPKSF